MRTPGERRSTRLRLAALVVAAYLVAFGLAAAVMNVGS